MYKIVFLGLNKALVKHFVPGKSQFVTHGT